MNKLELSPYHPRHYPVVLVLLSLSLGGLIFFHLLFWSPLQARIQAQEAQWRAERPKVGELKRYEKAQVELTEFWKVLPRRDSFPQLIAWLSDLGEKHRLEIPDITYQQRKETVQDLTRRSLSFGVSGTYKDIRSFIGDVERSDKFLIIEDLNLIKPGRDHKDPIQLQLRMVVYLRPSSIEAKG